MSKTKEKLTKKKTKIATGQNHDTSPRVFQNDKIGFDLNIYERNDLTDRQKELLELIEDKNARVIFINGPAGCSKAQPLDAKVLTPTGFVNMGDLTIGDAIMTKSGKETTVLEIHPFGKKEVFKVTFSDGSVTECCSDHLWFTQTEKDRFFRRWVKGTNKTRRENIPQEGSVKPLSDIIKSITTPRGRLNHRIPLVSPINFKENSHIIHPYILGVLIGDGCLKANVSFTSMDADIVDTVKKYTTSNFGVSELKSKNRCPTYNIVSESGKINSIKNELKRLKLWGKYSHEKFIPVEYLIDSVENRISLLRGLMDTDGTTNGCFTSYSTTSEQLAKDFKYLINSLGGTSSISKYPASYKNSMGEAVVCNDVYVTSICLNEDIQVFNLERKSDRYRPKTKYIPTRFIKSVESVGEKIVQCIKVSDESRLYVTDDFIVTHNTFTSIYAGLKLMNKKSISDIIYVRSIAESASKSLGSLPGEANDKMEPFLMPLRDKLEELLPKNELDRLVKEERIQGIPVNYLRGASINAKFVVIDEAQNLDLKELTTALTRIGKFAKFVILGDPMQSDINGRSGFMKMFDMFNNARSRDEGIHCFTFTKADIVRSGILKYIVEVIEGNAYIPASKSEIESSSKQIEVAAPTENEPEPMFPPVKKILLKG